MRIQNIIFIVTVGVLLMPGRETFVWAQATNVVCTGCVASTDIADLGVAGADLATSAVSSVKIADGAIVNADVSAAAAIAGTKVAPNFGSQNIITTGSVGIGTTTPNAASKLEVAGKIFAGSLTDREAVSGAYYTLDPSSATIAGAFNGSVGIGTATPSTGFKLDVVGKILAGGFTDRDVVSGALYTLDPSSATIAGTFNGSVGIGMLTPGSQLDMAGALTVRGMAAPAVAPAGQGRLYYDSTADKLKVSQNGAAYVDLLGGGGISQWATSGTNISYTTGNVGIGTTAPMAPLHSELLEQGVPTTADIISKASLRLSGGTSLHSSQLLFGSAGAANNTYWIQAGKNAAAGDTPELLSGYGLLLQPLGGNVGIGTTSPGAKLDIEGNLQMYTGGPWFHMLSQNSKNISLATVGGGIAIDQAGNVGIGTTSPGMPLVIKGDGSANAVGFNDGSNVQRGSIFVSSASLGLNANTKLYLTSNGSGITIDPDGNVGIGTTAPGAKLDVNGTLNAHNAMTVQAGAGNIVGGLSWASTDNGQLYLNNGGATTINIMGSGNTYFNGGNVGIGTTDPGAYKLAVKGKIHAEEVVVDTGWADFVFKKDYDLMPLEKVAKHIEEAGHLPGIPSEQEVRENGISIGQIQSRLLQKIEEMTLYVIDLKKEGDLLRKENETLKERISSLENRSR